MPTGVYPRKKKSLKERFESKFSVVQTGCWEWERRISVFGYGQFAIEPGNIWQAHRFAYKLYIGEIPKGVCVLHKCDNRKCVNPKHLWLGTQEENIRDMMAKGRDRKATSDKNGGAKLNWEKVIKIRSMAKYTKQKDICTQFGIERHQARRIIKWISWK